VVQYELVIKDKGRETAFGQFGQRSVSGGQGDWKTKEYTQHVSSTAVKTKQNKKARPHMRHMQMES
jgi:hypothetical protein